MITRRNKLNLDAREVQLAISFSSVDVKHWLREYMSRCNGGALTEDEAKTYFRVDYLSEQEVRYWSERDPIVFGNFDQPWRSRLSGWLWSRILAEGYLVQSSTEPDKYYYTDKGIALYRHNFSRR